MFNDDFKEASLKNYHDIIDQTNNELFQDFILRFAEKISDDKTNWNTYRNGSKNDFLALTRTIFNRILPRNR